MSATTPTNEQIELTLEGLHCAACVLRTENALTALPGVDRATVNLATERASVNFDPAQTSIPEFVRAVAELGYTATPITDPTAKRAAYGRDPLQTRMVVAIVLAIPTLALSMIPALQFNGWDWLAGVLATPVALWAAWPFPPPARLGPKNPPTPWGTRLPLGASSAPTCHLSPRSC